MHPSAEHGFGRAAGSYERGRPSYSPEAVAWLVSHCGIRAGSRVVDLAAGTGKLTRLLVDTGAELLAVEPVAAMRREFAAAVPEVEVVDGRAEALPLPDGSVDAVVVAAAFHWFDPAVATTEIARVLRPGGRLGLVWNRRDESDPLQGRISALIEPYRGDTPRYRFGGDLGSAVLEPVAQARLPMVQSVDRDRLVDRVVSISFVAALPEDVQRPLLAALRELAAAGPSRVELRYVTDLYAYQRP